MPTNLSVKSAFNLLLTMQGREMTLTRKGSPDVVVTAKFAPSNYSRILAAPGEMVTMGKEFVVASDSLSAFPTPPKRSDRLHDSNLGIMTIVEVREMFDIGGAIIGWRVRTG